MYECGRHTIKQSIAVEIRYVLSFVQYNACGCISICICVKLVTEKCCTYFQLIKVCVR